MIYLKEANKEDVDKEYAFFQSIGSENGFMNPFEGMNYETFCTRGLTKILNASNIEFLKPGRVPMTYFFLWNDDEIVGVFKIRHELNDQLRNGSGHIGFGILPQYRRLGYATKGLALALEKCRTILSKDTTEVYLSCFKNNIGSLKAQLNNKAYIHHEDEDMYYTRIKIR